MATFGLSHWCQAYEREIDVVSDAAFEHEMPVTVILVTLLVIGVFLNILCWRRRNITQILIHYELIYNSALTLVPYDYGDITSFVVFYWTFCVFMYASCSSNSSVIDILSCTIFTALQALLIVPLAQREGFSSRLIL